MKCIYCNKETKEIIDTHKIIYEDKIIINNVPAMHCNHCGDKYYSADILDNLEKIIETTRKHNAIDKKIILDYEKY